MEITVHLDEEQEGILRKVIEQEGITIQLLLQKLVDASIFVYTVSVSNPHFRDKIDFKVLEDIVERFLPCQE